MASSKMCESCIHHKVCLKDQNIIGEEFVPGNPMFFDNEELYKKYKDWEAKGFPCEDYLSGHIIEYIRCLGIKFMVEGDIIKVKWRHGDKHYIVPFCGLLELWERYKEQEHESGME